MFKQLSIKQKIISGFSGLGLLLVVASALAYVALRQISAANIEVKSVAVPILHIADELRLQQVMLSKLITQAFSQNDVAALNRSKKIFVMYMDTYQAKKHELQTLTQGRTEFSQPIQAAIEQISLLEQHGNALFKAKLTVIAQLTEYHSQFSQLQQSYEQASSAMLDLELIETDNVKLRDEVVGTGIRIDDMLFTLSNNAQGILALSLVNLAQHQDDMRFLLGNMEDNFRFLQRQATGLNTQTQFSEFIQAQQHFTVLLDGPQSIYQTLQSKLSSQDNVLNVYADAEKSMELAQQSLKQLQMAAKSQFIFYENIAQEKIEQAQRVTLLLAGVFVSLAVFIAIYTTKAMLGPLAAVNKMLGYLADGDFSREVKKRQDDEFGALIDNINTVKNNLKGLLEAIKSEVHELEVLSESSQVRSNLIAGNAMTQMQRMDNAAELSSSISNSAQLVSDESNSSLTGIRTANEQGTRVSLIANNNKQHMTALSEKMRDAVTVMERLSEHSQNIGSILDTIVSIAEQTNLLALNAAIEAARAGEQGRGFAVVADEVRTLASRTQSSTTEINQMIDTLQQDTETALQVIIQGRKEVGVSVEQSEALSAASVEIELALTEVVDMSTRVTDAALNQATDCQKIEVVMSEAQGTAKENADEMQHMAKNSESLSQFASSIIKLIERFKLSQ
ncbi:methyl-accepting chemotaxis protein [Pseudoalteromonas sp. MMG013]|uniref:methyl-accepting chemotaxis protein n=1 Tax=Pseudoalteromonas sp. MMG013 TaxID=2822687 RepID=UPI001B372A1F|nr:methyl-accepting chemotaxis protein [Pseudoalteromonas sp. MMG013]MBQ4861739.1 methyl-accepting chemotaxis protein [Pseudoalteromonas sp. MMG013]